MPPGNTVTYPTGSYTAGLGSAGGSAGPIDESPLIGPGQPNERRAISPTQPSGTLERAFAALSLIAATGTTLGAMLGANKYGWPAVLGLTSGALLVCAALGIWAQDRVVKFQRGEVALVYATALQGPRRVMFDRRLQQPTRLESLGSAMIDLVDSARMAVLGKDKLARWAMDMRRVVIDRTQSSEALAVALGEDAHAIAAAANASRRAEADITLCIGDVQMRASRAAVATADVADEANALSDAVRDVTAQASQAAALAARLADSAFAAQRGVSSLTDITATLSQAADQVKSVLQRAEMLGLNAGIEAARAGETGRGFAVVAGEMKSLATSGTAALDAMLGILRGLKTEASGMRKTTESMAEVIAAQGLLGGSLADAVSHQIESVGRVVHQVEAANAEIVALQERARDMEMRELGLAAGPAARKAVERLPAHAEAVAQILRDLPQFVTEK